MSCPDSGLSCCASALEKDGCVGSLCDTSALVISTCSPTLSVDNLTVNASHSQLDLLTHAYRAFAEHNHESGAVSRTKAEAFWSPRCLGIAEVFALDALTTSTHPQLNLSHRQIVDIGDNVVNG